MTKFPAKSISLRWLYVASALAGGSYGIFVRLLAFHLKTEIFQVMSIGFIFFMPFALGCIAVYVVELNRPHRIWAWISLPWLSVIVALAGICAAAWEGSICVVMFLPIGLLLSSIGGLLGGLAARSMRSRRAQKLSMVCVMALPFLISPWETQAFQEWETRQVENIIDIQAPPEIVWRNIERVSAIRPDQLPHSWAHAIGFPDPIEATLSHEGVGGVRNASFARNLIFLETIDVWELNQRLGFTIKADKVPSTTLDEHVTIGGPYFDVLRGEYRLERLSKNVTRLHLSSQHRLSTDFNWYAHLWTDAIMSDLQARILAVVQKRCQAEAQYTHSL